jgi:PAS domain S-box-containing protein
MLGNRLAAPGALDVRALLAALDHAPVGLVVCDAAGHWLAVNVTLCRLLGRERDQLVGLTEDDVLHPDEGPAHPAVVGAADRVERRWVRGDGAVVPVRLVVSPVVEVEGGQPDHWVMQVEDLSEQQRTRAELHRQAQQLAAVHENTDALVFVKDTQFVYRQVNPAFARLAGRTPEQCVGLTDWDLFPAEVATTYRRNDEDVVRTASRHERLVRVVDPVLGQRTYRSAKVPLLDEHGAVRGIAGVGTDLTDEVTYREVLEKLNAELTVARDQALAATQAKSSFLATVSHEVRTPLHGMLGMLEVMLSDELSDEQGERAAIALASGQSLLELLNGVLDLSKAEASSVEVRPRDVDPGRLLRDALDGVRGTAHLKGLSLDLRLAPGLPAVVRTDPDRLRQVLLNLLGNAVKFTDRGGVTLSATPRPGRLVLCVSDTGPGMPPADVDRLFAAFEQGDAGRRHGGTGLGLALCRQLTEALGGTLVATSSPAGSTFTVDVPVLAVEAGSAAVGVVAPLTTPPGLRVLLVDDSEVSLVVGGALLEQLGASVTTAGDGEAAVEAARSAPFDVVLMDRHLPGSRRAGRDARAARPARLGPPPGHRHDRGRRPGAAGVPGRRDAGGAAQARRPHDARPRAGRRDRGRGPVRPPLGSGSCRWTGCSAGGRSRCATWPWPSRSTASSATSACWTTRSSCSARATTTRTSPTRWPCWTTRRAPTSTSAACAAPSSWTRAGPAGRWSVATPTSGSAQQRSSSARTR